MLLAHERAHLCEQLRHLRHGVGIARIHDLLGAVEVEHPGIDRPADRQAPLPGQRIVRIEHRQHEGLVEDAGALARRDVAGRADRADDQVGGELLVEGPPRKVVVDTAVVEQHRIDTHWLEYQRNGHRRTHGLAQFAAPQHRRTAVVHVAGHAEKRYHQAVEITFRSSRRRSEKFGQRQVDLRRGDQVFGNLETLSGRAFDIDQQTQERGVVAHLPVIVHILVGVDTSRNPLLDHARTDDGPHLGRGVARGIHRRNDRPHRGAGHTVDRHTVLLERLQHADVVESLRAAAAHHHTHPLGCRREHPGKQQQDKYEGFTQHISIFL